MLMIICSCNQITGHDVENAITSLLDDDAWQIITPMMVYATLEKEGKCFGCFPQVDHMILRIIKQYHEYLGTSPYFITHHLDKIQQQKFIKAS